MSSSSPEEVAPPTGPGPGPLSTPSGPRTPTGPRVYRASPRPSSGSPSYKTGSPATKAEVKQRTPSDGVVSQQVTALHQDHPNQPVSGTWTSGSKRSGNFQHPRETQGQTLPPQSSGPRRQHNCRGTPGRDRSQRFHTRVQQKRAVYNMATSDAWRNGPALDVKVIGFSVEVTPFEVHRDFREVARIDRIDLVPPNPPFPDRIAFITFRPPPKEAFWDMDLTYKGYKISFPENRREYTVPDPLDSEVQLPDRIAQSIDTLEFGFMEGKESMMSMLKCQTAPSKPIEFELDLKRRTINMRFSLNAKNGLLGSHRDTDLELGRYEVRLRFEHLSNVSYNVQSRMHTLIIPADSSPKLFKEVKELKESFRDSRVWNRQDSWVRQTDVTRDEEQLRKSPTNFQRDLYNTILDTGRWTTYRITSKPGIDGKSPLDELCTALTRFNVQIVENNVQVMSRKDPDLWDFVNPPNATMVAKTSGHGSLLMSMMTTDFFDLSFETRYQLEVCLTQGVLHENNITREFLQKLAALNKSDKTSALGYLEKAALLDKRIFEPMDIFKLSFVYDDVHGNKRAPRYCTMARSAVITPTMIYYTTPAVEISNRVTREFSELSDRFLRVRFKAEKGTGSDRLFFDNGEQDREISARIKQVLTHGIVLGSRKYEFLAFGNSQFREHGAYFFAPTPRESCQNIRDLLGHWKEADKYVPSKVAARLGQNFSTTRGLSVKVDAKAQDANGNLVLPDVKRNGYCFTDGVGKISTFLATMIAQQFGMSSDNHPSVYQFRLGGCKGVLAVDPSLPGNDIHLRASQYKFAARHDGLEIIRASTFCSASLNRQLILILSVLGVPDRVFNNKLITQLNAIERALVDEQAATSELERNIDANHTSLTMSAMVSSGFMRTKEPFMMAMLQLWRSWMLKYLKEKAKINISQGAFLFGCIDETGTLRGHFNHDQPSPTDTLEERIAKLPEVFCYTDGYRRGVYEVIEGVCIVARNPSLHPGDIRVVHAVDVPQLHHLRNVVVFPQTGDRDISNMCSGGDLDGDDYIIISDPDLIPKEWTYPAMDFTPPKPHPLDRPAEASDLIDFFVEYMRSDKLGMIANAHLALSDFCIQGAKDERCIELAKLHSHAVDYPKSGIPVTIPTFIHNIQWPHFMEKGYRTYKSTKILGQLYDEVVKVDFCPDYEHAFDSRILEAYKLDATMLEKASVMKERYDNCIRQVMAQHGVATEFEIWSGYLMKHNGDKKDYTIAIELGDVVELAKKSLREDCIRAAEAGLPSNVNFQKLFPFVAAMYTVTAREIGEAVREHKSKSKEKIVFQNMPFMSFPWLFMKELGHIARRGAYVEKSIQPVQAIPGKHQALTKVEGEVTHGEVVTHGHIVPQGEIFAAFNPDNSGYGQGIATVASTLDGIQDGDPHRTVEVFLNLKKEKKPSAMATYMKMIEAEQEGEK